MVSWGFTGGGAGEEGVGNPTTMVSWGFTGAEAGAGAGAGAEEEVGGNPTTAAMVSFPLRNQNLSYHQQSLKLETVEESAENTSPGNMWQVYALDGFMVMRWIWARWRERNDGGQEEDPPGGDNDSNIF